MAVHELNMQINLSLTDVDECSQVNECSEHACCHNTAGSYYCKCREGYYGDGYTCEKLGKDCSFKKMIYNHDIGLLDKLIEDKICTECKTDSALVYQLSESSITQFLVRFTPLYWSRNRLYLLDQTNENKSHHSISLHLSKHS